MQKQQIEVMEGSGGSSRGDVLKRGTKRGASDSNLSSDWERFEKRLRMLSLRTRILAADIKTMSANV